MWLAEWWWMNCVNGRVCVCCKYVCVLGVICGYLSVCVAECMYDVLVNVWRVVC